MQSKSSINCNEKGIPIKGITCVIPCLIITSQCFQEIQNTTAQGMHVM